MVDSVLFFFEGMFYDDFNIVKEKKKYSKDVLCNVIGKWESNVLVIFCFVDEVWENGCGVLVYCLVGISWFVMVIVVYLM